MCRSQLPRNYWDCGLDVFCVYVVYCQVDLSATGWSLIQRSPTEFGVSECECEAPKNEEVAWPTRGCCRNIKIKKKAKCSPFSINVYF